MARFAVIPAKRSGAATADQRVKVVVGLLLAAAVLGPLGFLLSLAKNPQPQDTSVLLPLGRGLSEVVARDYLAGRVSPVPHTRDLDPQTLVGAAGRPGKPFAYDSLVWEKFERTNFGANFEVNYFIVIPHTSVPAGAQPPAGGSDAPGGIGPLELSVTTLLGADGSAVLAAPPTLTPWPGVSVTSKADGGYQDLRQKVEIDKVPGLQKQLLLWAAAYASGRGEDLKNLAHDTGAGRTYRALGGFTADNVAVDSVIPAGDLKLNLFVVRARVHLTGAQGSESDGFSSEASYDILVQANPNQDPTILAWGPAGAAGSLNKDTNVIPTS